MLDISYNYTVKWAIVENLGEFWKERLEEVGRVKQLMSTARLMFNLPTNRMTLEVGEGVRIYRITLMKPDVEKVPFGWLVYQPLKSRLDLYMAEDNGMPTIQWRAKKIVYENLSFLLIRCGVNNLLNKLVNAL